MEVPNDVIYNFIMDLKKRDIDDIAKARIVKEYMVQNNISLRSFSKNMNIPKTTVNNWLQFLKVSPEEYKLLEIKGYNKTQIRDAVYHNKIKQLIALEKELDFDIVIEKMITRLREYTREKPPISNNTSMLLYQLKETVVKVEANIRS